MTTFLLLGERSIIDYITNERRMDEEPHKQLVHLLQVGYNSYSNQLMEGEYG